MNEWRKKKITGGGGQETTRPHTVSTHTCEPQLILHQQKGEEKNLNQTPWNTHIGEDIRADVSAHRTLCLTRRPLDDTA